MGDVAVVGAGPVGVVAALSLARAGIEVSLFEREPELGGEPRAATVHPRTLEVLDELDSAQTVIECGLPITHLQYRSARTEVVADFDFKDLEGRTRFPFRLGAEQRVFTPRLLENALATGRCEVRFGAPVTKVFVTEHQVAVQVGRNGEEKQFFRYLIAADGAHSTIRHELGIGFTGMEYGYRFVMVRTSIDPGESIAGIAPVTYFYDPRESITVLTLRDHWRVVFRLPAESTDLAEGVLDQEIAVEMLGRIVGADAAVKGVIGGNVYTVHQRLASTFARGRVALAGDAAHLNNPTGGMGMNSGIQDASVLSGTIAGMLSGKLGEESLKDYATNRRSVAEKYVNRVTDRNFRTSVSNDDVLRKAWIAEMRATAADREKRTEYLCRASMLNTGQLDSGSQSAGPRLIET